MPYTIHLGSEDPILWPLLLAVVIIAASPILIGSVVLKFRRMLSGEKSESGVSFFKVYFVGSLVIAIITAIIYGCVHSNELFA